MSLSHNRTRLDGFRLSESYAAREGLNSILCGLGTNKNRDNNVQPGRAAHYHFRILCARRMERNRYGQQNQYHLNSLEGVSITAVKSETLRVSQDGRSEIATLCATIWPNR